VRETQRDAPPRVVVLGGGLAGLATAVALLDVPGGPSVELRERRAVLGGRAASSPGQDGALVDNCQHVLMRCCTNLWDFYGRLGVQSRIRFLRRLTFLGKDGQISTLAPSALPAPWHLLPAFVRFAALGARDKLAIARALATIARASEKSIRSLEGLPFDHWLQEMRQTPRAIERFWRVILVSALNEEIEQMSTEAAFQIFRLGFLRHPRAYEVGIPTVPLGELYEAPIRRRFQDRRAALHLRSGVQAIVVKDGAVCGVQVSDTSASDGPASKESFIPADHVVAAVPFDALPKLLPEEYRRCDAFRPLTALSHSPIAAVHLWYDRPVTDLDHAVLLDRTLQWMFNKTVDYGLDPERECYLGLVVSAARAWMPLPSSDILAAAQAEVAEAFPATRKARLLRSAVVKEAKATFSISPGVAALRPSHHTPVRGLWLAGDWTDTGWPATMEGAVRSGYRCAEEILSASGSPRSLLRPEGVFL
jgi:squalene-associated FAD-dependent desaturase